MRLRLSLLLFLMLTVGLFSPPVYGTCTSIEVNCVYWNCENCCQDFNCNSLLFDWECDTCYEECCEICANECCTTYYGSTPDGSPDPSNSWEECSPCAPYYPCFCTQCNPYPCNCFQTNFRCDGSGVSCGDNNACYCDCGSETLSCSKWTDDEFEDRISTSFTAAVMDEKWLENDWDNMDAQEYLTWTSLLLEEGLEQTGGLDVMDIEQMASEHTIMLVVDPSVGGFEPEFYMVDPDNPGMLIGSDLWDGVDVVDHSDLNPETGLYDWVLLSDGTKLAPDYTGAVWQPGGGNLAGGLYLTSGYVVVEEDVDEERWGGLGPECGQCQHEVYGDCYNYCSGTDSECGCTSCENCNARDTVACYNNRLQRQEGYCSGYMCKERLAGIVQDCCSYVVSATESDSGDGDNPATTNTCYGGTGAGCEEAACFTFDNEDRTDHCEGTCHTGTNGCEFYEYFPAQSPTYCAGNDKCGLRIYDADTNPNTCNTCKTEIDSTLNWNLGCTQGNDCTTNPDTCCGDDANEHSSTCVCNADACTCPTDTTACCIHQNSCVWNNGCYIHTHSEDLDSDLMTEYCLQGTWFTYPRIDATYTDINPVDRDKETLDTYDTILVTTEVYDQDNYDRSVVSITITNSIGTIEINNQEMSCIDTDKNHWKCTYSYNPRNDAPVGDYDIYINAVDKESLEDEQTYTDKFLVEDLAITNLAWLGETIDNTTDFRYTGTLKTLSNGAAVTTIIDQRCSEPVIQDLLDSNYDTRYDAASSNLRLCGVNGYDNTCTISAGNFNCYVQDTKLTEKTPAFSYILTNNDHISGSFDTTPVIDCEVNYFGVSDHDLYVNPYQNITYSINFTNNGTVGWHGKVYNQTHVKIWAPETDNPTGDDFVHVAYQDSNSYINLEAGTGRELHTTYDKNAHTILGDYTSNLDLRYFWPELINTYGYSPHDFSLCTSDTGYKVAAIDIIHHELPKSTLRGGIIIGEIGAYFAASMNLDYWEQVQAFTYRATNETTTGTFWVTKRNTTSNEETLEIPKTQMTWDGTENLWLAEINTFDLTTDSNDTTHRVYYLVNWTDYNIYVPYVDGEWHAEFYPYYWQEFNISYTGRDIFEVIPTVVTIPLGAQDRDIISINVINTKNETLNADILLVSRTYDDIINWMEFGDNTGYCEDYYDQLEGCLDTQLTIERAPDNTTTAEGNTVLRMLSAQRAGSYDFDLILKDRETGEEMGRKRIQINIVSEAIGNDNIGGLLLLFVLCTLVVLITTYKEDLGDEKKVSKSRTKKKSGSGGKRKIKSAKGKMG